MAIAKEGKLRTQQQAAEFLGCDARTIRRWIKAKRLAKDGDHFDREELLGAKTWYVRQINKLRQQLTELHIRIKEIQAAYNSEIEKILQEIQTMLDNQT